MNRVACQDAVRHEKVRMRKIMGLFLKLRSHSKCTAASLSYPLRVAFAAMMALSISTGLHLEEPHWAAWTVISVGLPVRGDSLRKSFNRLLGTLIGVTAAVTLLLTLQNNPYLLMLALAIWLGLCVYIGSLLRGFRSYAGVLAGYTAVIITMEGLAAGGEWRHVCISRTFSILIGIFGGAVASIASTQGNARPEFLKRLQVTTSSVCLWVGQRIDSGRNATDCVILEVPRVRSIFSQIAQMDTDVSSLIAEVPRLWRLRGTLRNVTGQLMELVFAARILDRHLRHSKFHSDQQSLVLRGSQSCFNGSEVNEAVLNSVDALTHLLRNTADALAAPTKEQLTLSINDLKHFAENASTAGARSPAERRILDSEIAISSHLSHLLSIDLRSPEVLTFQSMPRSVSRFVQYQDRLKAGINGVRACLVLAGCGTVWQMTHWRAGAAAVIFAAILIALYAMKDQPHRASFSFLAAGVQGVAVALTLRWLYLALHWNRFELILGEGFVILIAVTIGTESSNRLWTTGFGIIFLSLTDPAGLLALTWRQSAGEAIGTLAGVAVAAAAYSLLPPAWMRLALQRSLVGSSLKNPGRALRVMVQRMNSGVSRAAWSSQRFDWIMRILLPVITEEQLAQTIRLTDAEIEMLRLRDALHDTVPENEAFISVQDALARLRHLPLTEALRELELANERLKRACASGDQKMLRAKASLAMLILDLDMLRCGDKNL